SSERFAIDRVNGHAFAGRYDANNAITRQRVTAAGVMHRHARNEATDRHRIFGLLAARRGERHDLRRALLGLRRMEYMHDLASGMQPLTHRDIEIVECLDVEGAEDFA